MITSRTKSIVLHTSGAVWFVAAHLLMAAQNPMPETSAQKLQDEDSRIYSPTAAASAVSNTGPIDITIQNAILLALENNRSLAVQRLTPPITRTYEAQERAVFDPVLGAQIGRQQSVFQQTSSTNTWSGDIRSHTTTGSVSLATYLPTGTRVSLAAAANVMDTDISGTDQNFSTARGGVSVSQALLRGGSIAANLANLRQARLDTRISAYALRGYAEALVADVETTCWEYILAQQQIDIYTNSLHLAEQQLFEIKERIRVGKLPAVEQAAAEAEVALRQEGLINARSIYDTTRLHALRLINPPGTDLWDRVLIIQDRPTAEPADADSAGTHVQVALRWRPDLNEARLLLQRGDLEVVKTRNGLLPKLDMFVNLGKTGYAYSFRDSVDNSGQDDYDLKAGLAMEYPIGNRDAKAQYRRAKLTSERSDEALANMIQLAEVDIRSACIEVHRARQQVTATAVTSKAQLETVKAETEKFKVGKSTSLLLTTAERNLLASKIEEVRAVVAYLKALTNLYRQDGSLLERRGIAAPGRASATP